LTFKSIIDEIENNLYKILSDLGVSDISFTVEPAKPGFGDVSSNISFLLAKNLKKSPQEISNVISEKYSEFKHTLVLKVESHRISSFWIS
jgi:arginyl-tRNA synthetase